MKKLSDFSIKISVFLLLLAGYFHIAEAANLYVAPPLKNASIGEEFFLDIKTNTEEVSINAVQATIHFANSILTAVGVDKTNSVLNFWVQEPEISNENGTISFIGGTSKGVSGEAVQILRIKFKASGSGSGDIVISGGTVAASDGKGTNVLSKTAGGKLIVGGPGAITVPPLFSPAKEQPKKVEQLVPAIAKNLPNQPQLSIPIYPDPLRWYSHDGEVVVFWDVPNDVTDVAIILDRRSNTNPNLPEKELFNGKNFGPIEEGIWYIHIKFKNNLGWGPVAHYKILIDRTVPIPFEVKTDNLITDNPQPIIYFKPQDALSGLREIAIFIDDKDPIKISATSTFFVLPLQKPGKHRIIARAFDKADNTRESDIDLEIFPILSPTLNISADNLFAGEGKIFLSGTSLPGNYIFAVLKDKDEKIIFEINTEANEVGNWETLIDYLIPKGSYFVEVTSQDKRGALSLPVRSDLIKIKNKPIFKLGALEVTQFWFLVILILILISVFFIGWFSYRFWLRQARRRAVITQREFANAVNNLDKAIDKMSEFYVDDKIDSSEIAGMQFFLKRIRNNLSKVKKYISESIEEILK